MLLANFSFSFSVNSSFSVPSCGLRLLLAFDPCEFHFQFSELCFSINFGLLNFIVRAFSFRWACGDDHAFERTILNICC